ncbi:hypothetical protein ACIQC7_35385 [Kitasatospora sp. NPDC088556]|uniref:hypothetical protein n=1 Tax=Kitasatospora sp. NPDC088556 TaxID=3364076 RepID=UPI0038093697
MMLAIGALLGCAATLLALAIRRRLTLTPHCGWCATASNWPTSRHDALFCRGYVQDRRCERLRDIRHGSPVEEPNPWGEAYLPDEEIAQRTEADAMRGKATTAVGDFGQALAELTDGYPTDSEGTVPVIVTVTDPATGEQYPVPIEPGQLDWVTALVRDELDTFRAAHSDESGYCGHCRGTGSAGGPGGAGLLDEPPADDESRP